MNIYVGNLSWEVNDDVLQSAFSEFGEVTSAAVIKDKFSGKSRGFGFVEMPKTEEAEAAIKALDGKDLKGRDLRVNEARARTERKDNKGFGGGGGGRRF